MSNMAWSEQELANAAKRVAESMLTSFPSPSECEHVFSDDFEHSMEILRKKSKRRVVAHKIWQRAAVILIVTILSVSTWLTVDIQARERAFQWIKEIYESIAKPGKTIHATLQLWQGRTMIDSWSGNGTSYLLITGSHEVTKGKTYTVKVVCTVDGQSFYVNPATATA